MHYDLYIFDLDGTICNSFEGIKVSLGYMLEKMGRKIPSDEVFRSMIGPPFFFSMRNILKIEETYYEEGIALYRGFFEREGYKYFSIYEGMRTVLRSLRAAGHKVALATSKPIQPTMKLLKYFGLVNLFDSINAPADDTVKNSKEYAIKESLKLPHKRAVMIGDRYFDADGAKYHGIDFVGAAYGFPEQGELEKTGAVAIAKQAFDLLKIFDVKALQGKFISLEGVDGSGKSTQIALLQKKLEKYGFYTKFTREPGGTKIGEAIRGVLLSTENAEMGARTEALLYAASRAQHVEEFIQPNLKEGLHVICDRFVDSSIAYQGGGRNLGLEKVKDINDFAIAGLYPDKTVLLQMDVQESLKRRQAAGTLDRLEVQKMDFFLKTQETYEALLAQERDRFLVVPADRPIEEVAEDCFVAVATYLEPETDWKNCKYE